VSRAVPTGFDEEAAGALLQAGAEVAQSNAELAEHSGGEVPLGDAPSPQGYVAVAFEFGATVPCTLLRVTGCGRGACSGRRCPSKG
jgi:hypothetical protein